MIRIIIECPKPELSPLTPEQIIEEIEGVPEPEKEEAEEVEKC